MGVARITAVVLMAAMLAACSSMDAPHDPKFPRHTLMDQIPNSERGALSVCAGHIDPALRLAHQSGRC